MSLSKHALVGITLSLLSATNLQAMNTVEGEDAGLPKTPTLTLDQNKLPNSISSTTCSGFDPRCGDNTRHRATLAVVSHNTPKATQLDDLNQNVLSHLQSFDVSPEISAKLWEDFHKIATEKGQFRPFTLGTQDPYFIASGLWRAYQEILSLDTTNRHTFSFKTLLSALLTREVYVKGGTFTEKDCHMLKSLVQPNPYFRKLDLFESGITDSQLSILGTIPHLTDLNLEKNKITDQNLALLSLHPHLKRLNLSDNKITAKGAQILAQSKTLEEVNLSHNSLGDEGAEAFASNTVVLSLDLRHTGMGDRGAQALGTMNKTIKSLRLRHNKITDKGALAFLPQNSQNTHLTHLELERNQVSPDIAHFLQHLMPSYAYVSLYQKLPGTVPALQQKDKVRVLSIDGGGIRGLLPALILKHIGDQLEKKINAQFDFARHVDLMAGTSTGGLISLALTMPGDRGRPKYTPQTLVDIYSTKGPEIFPAPWCCLKVLVEAQYDPKPLEASLEGLFGDTPFSASLAHTMIASFDLGHNAAHIFDSQEARRDSTHDFTLRGVGRATSAAPTYFPSAKIKNQHGQDFEFVDGGIYANNPTLLAIKKAQSMYPQAKEIKVYSLGTGQATPKSLSDLGNDGIIGWGLNIVPVLMNNAANYTDSLLQKEIAHDPRIKYVRIQPHITDSEESMDNVKADNIENLKKTALNTMLKYKLEIAEIIEDFVKDFGGN